MPPVFIREALGSTWAKRGFCGGLVWNTPSNVLRCQFMSLGLCFQCWKTCWWTELWNWNGINFAVNCRDYPWSERCLVWTNYLCFIKGTLCLGSVPWIGRVGPWKSFEIVCLKMHTWFGRCFKSRIQWSTQICLEITRFSFTPWNNMARQFVESSFWLHKMADRVSSRSKRKTMQFLGIFCVDHSTFKLAF